MHGFGVPLLATMRARMPIEKLLHGEEEEDEEELANLYNGLMELLYHLCRRSKSGFAMVSSYSNIPDNTKGRTHLVITFVGSSHMRPLAATFKLRCHFPLV
ncbi:hypothetical protein BHM03_00022068 [Ensete ventricosum]|nr:hypothetical protein BHM03_00022068 [Ensete ventricosum]